MPAVLAKGRSDAAYAIAMGLCEHLNVSLYRARTCFFVWTSNLCEIHQMYRNISYLCLW